MSLCPACGVENDRESRSCLACGTALPSPRTTECPHCGTLNPAQNTFCDSCEGSLSPASTFPSGDKVPHLTEGTIPIPVARQEPVVEGSGDDSDIPEWLVEMQPEEGQPDSAALGQGQSVSEHSPTAPASAGTGEAPEWLMPTSPVEDASDAQLAQPEKGLPEWLGEASPTVQQNVQDKEGLSAAAGAVLTPVLPGEPETVEINHGPALVPSRTPEKSRGQARGLDARQSTGTRDLLVGLRGILPVAGLVSQPQSGFTPGSRAPSADSAGSQARVFADIVAQPPQPHPPGPPQPKGRRSSRVARLVVYAALVALVALPLLRGRPLLSRKVVPNPALVDLHETLEALSAGAIALVAFDYDPSSSEEMDLLAKTVVAHLLDRNARVVAVSLLPAGAATAQELLEEVIAEHPEYGAVYGQHYANLGFVPGQAVAIRLLNRALPAALPRDFFGNPVEDLPVVEGVYAVKDLDLIIELAAEQDSLRWWIEQAATPSGVPLGAGVSASVEPLARPYYQTGTRQLRGYAAGVVGAAAYEALRSGTDRPPDPLGVRLDSQLAGHLVLILVILAGNGVYLAERWAGRKS